jgi:perosamine synthetase
MRRKRQEVADLYVQRLSDVAEIELPEFDPDRVQSWHLFPIRICTDRLTIDRNAFMDDLRDAGVRCSVHSRPLHLHPYYEDTFGWRPEDLPVATATWSRLISLPIFSAMREDEMQYVVDAVRDTCARCSRVRASAAV